MKKIVFITLTTILTASGAFFFMKAKDSNVLPSQAEIGNNVDPRALNSFKGILDIEYEKPVLQTGEEAVPENPFDAPVVVEKENSSETSDNSSSLTFAILGDTQYFTAGFTKGNFQRAVANIQKENPDLVVSVGDLIRNCRGGNDDARDYANWKNTLGPLTSKTYAVQGNHDRVEDEEKCDRIWAESFNFPSNGPSGFTEFAYSLNMKNAHFVFLDSNKPDAHKINSTQREWLENDLSKNSDKIIFAVFHEPAYPVSDKATESLDANPSDRNAVWDMFEKHQVAAVFNGHEHIVSRKKAGSVYRFVFGSTDSFNHGLPASGVTEFASQGQGRFGLVKVDGKKITVETRGPDGKVLDTFSFSK